MGNGFEKAALNSMALTMPNRLIGRPKKIILRMPGNSQMLAGNHLQSTLPLPLLNAVEMAL